MKCETCVISGKEALDVYIYLFIIIYDIYSTYFIAWITHLAIRITDDNILRFKVSVNDANRV
jgi:hypothetical protein